MWKEENMCSICLDSVTELEDLITSQEEKV